jgi:hypothetical protein
MMYVGYAAFRVFGIFLQAGFGSSLGRLPPTGKKLNSCEFGIPRLAQHQRKRNPAFYDRHVMKGTKERKPAIGVFCWPADWVE